jgi:hypothetical protein
VLIHFPDEPHSVNSNEKKTVACELASVIELRLSWVFEFEGERKTRTLHKEP